MKWNWTDGVSTEYLCTNVCRASGDNSLISENAHKEKCQSVKRVKWTWPKPKCHPCSPYALWLPGAGEGAGCLQKYCWLPLLQSQNNSILISCDFLSFIKGLLQKGKGWEDLQGLSTDCCPQAPSLRLWRAGKKRKRQNKKGGRSTTLGVTVYLKSSCPQLGASMKWSCQIFIWVKFLNTGRCL